jgi:hypothetical protein
MEEVDSEDALEGLLDEIVGAIEADVDGNFSGEQEDELFAAVESWASVVSHAVAHYYAPSSPWPRNLAGWGTRVTARLQRAIQILLRPLQVVQQAVGASSCSISGNFPWGISVGFSW